MAYSPTVSSYLVTNCLFLKFICKINALLAKIDQEVGLELHIWFLLIVLDGKLEFVNHCYNDIVNVQESIPNRVCITV